MGRSVLPRGARQIGRRSRAGSFARESHGDHRQLAVAGAVAQKNGDAHLVAADTLGCEPALNGVAGEIERKAVAGARTDDVQPVAGGAVKKLPVKAAGVAIVAEPRM